MTRTPLEIAAEAVPQHVADAAREAFHDQFDGENFEFAMRCALVAADAAAWQDIATAPTAAEMPKGRILVHGGNHSEPTVAAPDGEWWRVMRREGLEGLPTRWRHLPEAPR